MAGRGRKRAWVKWTSLAAGGLLLVAVAIVWLLFQHVPRWYRPAEIAPEHLQDVRNDLLAFQNDLGERMALSDSVFEIRVSQKQVNAWLAAREDIWPLSREWLPEAVNRPFVVFEAGGVRVGATCQYGSVQSVVSVLVGVAADENLVHCRVVEVNSGSLPLPRDTILKILEEAFSAGHFRLPSMDGHRRTAELSELFTGLSFSNMGVWWEPRRRFRVVGVRLEPGMLMVKIRPLAFADGRRR